MLLSCFSSKLADEVRPLCSMWLVRLGRGSGYHRAASHADGVAVMLYLKVGIWAAGSNTWS